jgi:hypothetical protein
MCHVLFGLAHLVGACSKDVDALFFFLREKPRVIVNKKTRVGKLERESYSSISGALAKRESGAQDCI